MAVSGITCQSCHVRSEEGCSDGTDACNQCHVAGYKKLVPRWQKTIRKKVSRLNKLLQRAVDDKLIPEYPPAIKEFIDLLKKDGSAGVHNIFMINDLLDRSIDTTQSFFFKKEKVGEKGDEGTQDKEKSIRKEGVEEKEKKEENKEQGESIEKEQK